MHVSGIGHFHVGLDDSELSAGYDHSVVWRLLAFALPYKKLLATTLLSLIIYSGTVVGIPWIIQSAIDDHIGSAKSGNVAFPIIVFFSVTSTQYLFNYLHLRSLAIITQKVLYKLRLKTFSHIQSLSLSFFDTNPTGKIMSRIQNDIQQLQEFLSILILSFADLLSLVGITVAMILMHTQLALTTVTIIPFLFIAVYVWQKYARPEFLAVRYKLATLNSELQENISGIRLIQSVNRQKANIEHFSQTNNDYLSSTLRTSKISNVLLPIVEMLTAVGLSLVVVFGAQMIAGGDLTTGILIAFVLYIQRFFDPIRNLTMHYTQLQRAMASGSRVFSLLDQKPAVADRPSPVVIKQLIGTIEYKNVSFEYKENIPVLNNINFVINPGENIALVGPTGAGKTTIIKLLLRFYDVTNGGIFVDQYNVKELSRSSYTANIGLVPQDPHIFSGTILDNIRYNTPDISLKRIKEITKLLGADQFIEQLPNGYLSAVGERGTELSAGYRQLLSFTRAVVKNPKILVLDEATSYVDTPTEILIQQALGILLKSRTSIIIAHRLSTVRHAHRILVVDQGKIVAEGTHDQLMLKSNLYRQLCDVGLDNI